MHPSTLLLPLLPLSLALSPRQPTSPGAAQIIQSINNIDTAVRSLSSSLTAYTGGINESLPVFAATLEIHRVNRAGFASNKNVAGPLSSSDSQQVDKTVNDTVGVSIPAATKILEAKKPLFDAAELTSVVESTITLLRGDHESFSLGVGEKLSLDGLPGGLSGAGAIEAVLIGAGVYYAA